MAQVVFIMRVVSWLAFAIRARGRVRVGIYRFCIQNLMFHMWRASKRRVRVDEKGNRRIGQNNRDTCMGGVELIGCHVKGGGSRFGNFGLT